MWVFRRTVKLLVAAGGRLCPLGSWELAGFFLGGGLSPGYLAGLGKYRVESLSLWRGGSTSVHSCASHTPSSHAQRGGAGILDVAQGSAGGLWCYSCPRPWSPAINTQATPLLGVGTDGVGTGMHGWARWAEASTAPGDLLAHATPRLPFSPRPISAPAPGEVTSPSQLQSGKRLGSQQRRLSQQQHQ